MTDILHDFPIAAPPNQVFEAITSPTGLDAWWTKRAAGTPVLSTTYQLGFGSTHDWLAIVHTCDPNAAFALKLTHADTDWLGTHVGFRLVDKNTYTQVHFYHTGWPEANAHYRTSSFCWAMYLRLLKRYVEHGAIVPYQQRLEV